MKLKFNIPKIKFDGDDFIFHSTLFQDIDNDNKLKFIYDELKLSLSFPIALHISEVNFGISKNGKVGTYKVYNKLNLNK